MKKTLLAVVLLSALCSVAAAQTIQNLVHQPNNGAGVSYLMTDGTVLTQGGSDSDWWKLTPDNRGSYVNGTWTQVASLPAGYVPLYFPRGRAGGWPPGHLGR